MISLITNFLTNAIQSGTSVLYGIYGETITERSGIVNLGTEGSMILGAIAAYIVAADSGSMGLAIICAMLAGGALALIHAYLCINRKANQLASGLTLMFLGLGIAAFYGREYVSVSITGLNKIAIPLLSKIPVIGEAFFNQDILTYLSFALCPVLWWFLYKTRKGLFLRAAGEDKEVVYAYGKNPQSLRYLATVLGGMISAIGGAQLSIAYTKTWSEGMTNGRGIIAVSLVVLAKYNPSKAMIGAYVYGGAQALNVILQSQGVEISPFLLMMLPYVITLVALFVSSVRKGTNAPNELKNIIGG